MKHRQFNLSEEAIRDIEERERETREALELRRLQGVRMYGSGLSMTLIEEVTGAARRTVADWVKAYQKEGVEGLKPGWKGEIIVNSVLNSELNSDNACNR